MCFFVFWLYVDSVRDLCVENQQITGLISEMLETETGRLFEIVKAINIDRRLSDSLSALRQRSMRFIIESYCIPPLLAFANFLAYFRIDHCGRIAGGFSSGREKKTSVGSNGNGCSGAAWSD